ncbi:hypothetical protein RYZ20_07945 [Thioclava sp. A2]|uniref:hypothetical protein n=1 Tax=Thioclava sp. FCG-A2 TaxID=3080562 RepID=UPI002955BE05|nr:hypothetical protein [Thioclava sp. A2]MDV7270832.1 hypothetical protein [Thioclava sp. A2]
MARKPDWQALGALFDQTPPAPATAPPSTNEDGTAVYNGERLPKWLVRDLMQERAAIREYGGGMTREEAEALTLRGLQRG